MGLSTPGDRIAQTSTTTGIGTYDLDGSIADWKDFLDQVSSGSTVHYLARYEDGSAGYEIGEGVVTSGAPDTLTRGTIYSSSNADAAVNWGAGNKEIIAVFCAEDVTQILARTNHTGTQPLSTISDSGALAALDTVSSSEIDAGAVTNVELANMAGDTIKGRQSTTGTPADLTAAQVRSLINVEDGATADQTGAEIKIAYEAEANTNAFTDADHTKLDGIAANANNYVHPNDGSDLGAPLTGANVISDVNVNAAGHVTGFATRVMTLGDLGYTGDTNANNYSHPNHTGQVTSTGDGATALAVSAITAQTALTSGLAGTDELLVSDAGVLKRMDVSVLEDYFDSRYVDEQFREMPQNIKNSNYTMVLDDSGKHLYHSNTTAYTWTIPPNSSVAYPIGTVIGLVNTGSGNITVARGSGVVLRWVGDGTDANRTLEQDSVATIMKVATDTWMINGGGIS